MKKFKKLIPAFCMLLVSAIMLGSSTFAWFSMNTKVTASGMQVTAKSNSTYLLINAEDKTGTEMDTTVTTEIDAQKPGITELYPAAFFKKVDAATTMGKKDGTTDFNLVTDGKVTAGDNVWVTANNTKRDGVNNYVTNVKQLNPESTAEFANYAAAYKVWLTLSKDSEAIENQYIKITKNVKTDAGSAKAVVKIGDEWIEVSDDAQFTTAKFTLSNTTKIEVVVYVYIDGNNANVKTVTDILEIKGSFALDFEISSTNA